MLIISNSTVNDFLRCPRLYDYRHNHKRVPATLAPQLLFGNAWHEACEDRLVGREPRTAWRDQLSAKTRGIFDVLWAAYCNHYPNDETTINTIETEMEVSTDVGDTTIRGKIDAVVRTTGGEILLLEHKSTRAYISGDSVYWRLREHDRQTRLYLALLQANKNLPQPTGVVYNVARVPVYRVGDPIKKLTSALEKDASSFFQRRRIDWSQREIGAALGDAVLTAGLMQAECFPQNTVNCVYNSGGECDYYKVCWNGGIDTLYSDDYRNFDDYYFGETTRKEG